MSALQVRGLSSAVDSIASIPESLQRSVLRKAMSAAVAEPRKTMKRFATKRSGALKKSIVSKVSTNTTKGTVSGTVGPNRRYVVIAKAGTKYISGINQITKAASGPVKMGSSRFVRAFRTSDIRTVKPSRYAHLAGPGQEQVFVDAAWMETKSVALKVFAGRSQAEMKKVAAKLQAKAAARK